MAAQALLNVFTYAGGYDFTCDQNMARVEMSSDSLSGDTMCSPWAAIVPGKKSLTLAQSGLWQAGDGAVDPAAWGNLGSTDKVITIGYEETEATTAYMFHADQTQYEMFGTHGEVAPFTLAAVGSNGVGAVKGQLAAAKATCSGTGAFGTGCQLGAVASDEYLYATLHVFDADSATITVTVESDDNASFTSATTRISFTGVTTADGFWGTRVAGALTDDYYRINVTSLSGGTPVIAAAIGIG